MAATVTNGLFRASFEAALSGVTTRKYAARFHKQNTFSQLTEATKAMLQEPDKSQVKNFLSDVLQQLQGFQNQEKAKSILLSIFKAIDPKQAELESSKEFADIASALRKKTEEIFKSNILNTSTAVQKEQPKTQTTQIEAQKPSSATKPNNSHVKMSEGDIRKMQFSLVHPIHASFIKYIKVLADSIQPSAFKSSQEGLILLNEASVIKRTVQDVLIDLSKYQSLSNEKGPKQIGELKTELEANIKVLSENMNEWIQGKEQEVLKGKQLEQAIAVYQKAEQDAMCDVKNLDKQFEAHISLIPKQKTFLEHLNKAISDESQIDERLKTDLKVFGQRMLPLIKTIEENNVAKADSFSLAYMMLDYSNLLNYLYDKLKEGMDVSKQEYLKVDQGFYENRIHELEEFTRNYQVEFMKHSLEITKLIPLDALKNVKRELDRAYATKRGIDLKLSKSAVQ